MLRRRVEFDVIQWDRKSVDNGEELDRAIQVHVKDSILIVPYPLRRPCYLVADKENAIITRIRLDLAHRGARIRPGLDSRLLSHGATSWRKAEIRRAAGD